jgi:hypothetical protein
MSLEARLEWRSPIAGHVDRLVINHSVLQADGHWLAAGEVLRQSDEVKIGRASCRERVCAYV